MNELISRSALIEKIREYADEVGCVRGEYELANGILKAISVVEDAPTVEAKPVVLGEWDKKIMNYCCSQCTTAFYDNLAWITDEFKLPNFCPNCGADMRGEKNG